MNKEILCDRCKAPVNPELTDNIEWYACKHCGFGQIKVDGVNVQVVPGNTPEIHH